MTAGHADEVTAVPSATVRFWAGARQARGVDSEQTTHSTVGALRQFLGNDPAFSRLADIVSFLVDNQIAGDATPIPAGSVVDVLPPFAGG